MAKPDVIEPPEAPPAPTAEDFARLSAQLDQLRAQLGLRDAAGAVAEAPVEASKPDIEPPTLDPKAYRRVLPTDRRTRPELYEPMRELALPKAQFPEECLFAVQLATQGKGYTPALPRPRGTVPLADPGQALLIPILPPGQVSIGGDAPDALRNPGINLIGHGSAIPWFVPSLGVEVFCDPRAAAAAKSPLVTKIGLWCPVRGLSPGSTHAHGDHGPFCGIGEEPDRVQAMTETPEDAGRCPACKADEKQRAKARRLVAVWLASKAA